MVKEGRTLKVPNQRQGQRQAVAIQLLLDILPGRNQDDGLGGVAAGSLKNAVEVLARVFLAGRVVCVVLAANLESNARQDVLQLVVYPANSRLAKRPPSPKDPDDRQATGEHALVVVLVHHLVHLVPIRPEDMLFAAAKVGVHLAGQQGVLGYVGSARVVVERKEEQPDDADDDTEEGDVRRQFEYSRVATQRERRS